MKTREITLWKKSPAARLLISLVAGIIIEWYGSIGPATWLIIFISSLLLGSFYFLIPFFHRFRSRYFNGFLFCVLFISSGGIRTWLEDIRNHPRWLGHLNAQHQPLLLQTAGEAQEKPKSFKITADVLAVYKNGDLHHSKGRIIIYLKKDSLRKIPPGTLFLTNHPLQEISNQNTGFDYKRYCLFKGITHQVFLARHELVLLDNAGQNKILEKSKSYVISLLRKSVKTEKETGLAEALLIGYKDDLDPGLVKSYTDTGVVHIIAISGLHLGLIYWMLSMLLGPVRKNKKLPWLPPLVIISGLWMFSLLAGAQPSVLRSALMFSCITISEAISRKSNIYNSLAVSAILLLLYDPFWLWDIGFQLSYAAVLSIIIYQRAIYGLIFIQNKLLDLVWKMNAVTLAAQVLTIPICIYYFHQFPNYFLLTNMVAVPLSGLILFTEIFLCITGELELLSNVIGKLIAGLVRLLNNYIEMVAALPNAVTRELHLSFGQLVVYYAMLAYLYAHAKKD